MAVQEILNAPFTDPFARVQNIQSQTTLQKQGQQAGRELVGAMEDVSQAERAEAEAIATARRAQLAKQKEVTDAEVLGKTTAYDAFEAKTGKMPERTITAFNPERATELAVLTAIMGAFAGSISGRAGMSAMKGISEGYRTGQEDLYKREVDNFNAAMDKYKQEISEAKQVLVNAIEKETLKRGAADVELAGLDPQLAGPVIAAHLKSKHLQRAFTAVQEKEKLFQQMQQKSYEAGLRPTAQKTQTILDDQGQGWLVDINRYVPGTPLKIGTPGVYGLSATGAQAAAKTTAAASQKEEGARKFNFILNRLDELYKDLRQMNAITDTDKSVGQNLTSFTATLSPVQMGQRAIGGKAQAMRDEIKALQATLLQSIMQATGMSARSLDSNKELEFYLQAATDPTKSFQTNLSAMNTLRSLYGRLEENTYPENEQELIIIRYGAYEPQKYKYEFTSNNQITRTPLPPVKPVSPTQQGARTSQPATGAEIVQQEGETRLEFLRRKRAAGQLKE